MFVHRLEEAVHFTHNDTASFFMPRKTYAAPLFPLTFSGKTLILVSAIQPIYIPLRSSNPVIYMKQSLEIAIIDANTLSAIGLRELIIRMMPFAVIRTFDAFESFMRDTPDMYVHYFISSQTLLEHTAFFLERKNKTIVLTNGITGITQSSHFHTLNIFQNEESMIRSLLQLQQSAHAHGKHLPAGSPYTSQHSTTADPNGLSFREIEVLVQIVSGLTNKEIADRLHIGITTVISHRKNIMEKLNVHSVSGLTIYAVMNGYIEADRI